jgi:RND family efflux transporter MFP subunit
LLTAAMKSGLDLRKEQQDLSRTDAIPFESQHRFMATLYHDHLGNGFIFVKGAPERLIEMCDSQRDGDQGKRSLDRDPWLAQIDEIAAKGQRVLGVAVKYTVADHCDLTFADVETGLTFLGLIGLIDPPREETIDAVRQCAEAGIGIKMITGDHAATAAAIGRELGLENPHATLTGRDIDALSDEELRDAAVRTTIFARTSPEHKLRLVRSLQDQGQLVAMTGDGVNDAPALKRADIGIAMGVKGTEAAKEAAEMVLADDNFASIVHAVHEGRVVYDNLRKCIMYMLAISSSQALTIVAAIAFGEALPITPIQILWVNLVDGVTLGLALAFEAAERNIMERPPRSPRHPIVSRYFLGRTAFVSFLVLIATFGLYELETMHGANVETARTVAVNTLVACGIGYIFSVRRLIASSLSWDGLFGSRPVLLAVSLIVVFQALFTYAPWFQTLFGTSGLGVRSWLSIIAAGVSVFAIAELEKAIRRGRMSSQARPAAKVVPVLPDVLGALALIAVAGGWLYFSVISSPTVVTATGVVASFSVAPIPAQTSGVVQAVYCDPGTKVTKGQLCAKLDLRPFDDVVKREKDALAAAEATLSGIKARLAAAQAELDRNTALSRRRAISRKALAASRRAVTQAQARVSSAEAAVAERRDALAAAEGALGKTDVLAPSEGIVVERNVEPGQKIVAGAETPPFRIATDLEKVRVAIEVAEKDAGKIEVGDAAVVSVATLPGKKFSGAVSGVRRTDAGKNGVTYEIAIDTPNPEKLLEPGMTATAIIDVDNALPQ